MDAGGDAGAERVDRNSAGGIFAAVEGKSDQAGEAAGDAAECGAGVEESAGEVGVDWAIVDQRFLSWAVHEEGAFYWEGDVLVDIGNGCRFHLDGSKEEAKIYRSSRFDGVKNSPSGRFQVYYQRLGTKGLIFNGGTLVREINRSFYQSEVYDYPVELFRLRDGREVIVHCPEQYNVLQIEELETGKCLTEREPEKFDFFHSRLQISPDRRWLLDAGWFWQPWDTIALYDVDEVLENPAALDSKGIVPEESLPEVLGATFCGGRLIVTGGDEVELPRPEGVAFGVRRQTLAVVDVPSGRIISEVARTRELGTLLPVDERYVLSLYKHPKLVDLESGDVVREWPEVFTGSRFRAFIRSRCRRWPIRRSGGCWLWEVEGLCG